MKFNDIDNIYCINLDNRKDKWELCEKEFLKNNLNVERFSGFNYTKCGNVGCNISHMNILKNAKKNNYKNILIFEDDIFLVENLINKFNKITTNINKFDLLYLSMWLPKGKIVYDGIIKIEHGFCTHSYIINHKVFDFLIEKINSLKHVLAIDNIYNKYHKYMNNYCIEPALTKQTNIQCDINNSYIYSMDNKNNRKFNLLK